MEKDTTTKPAGRPPIYEERMTRVTITLPQDHVDLLKVIGKGNLSEGVRTIIDQRIKRVARMVEERIIPVDFS